MIKNHTEIQKYRSASCISSTPLTCISSGWLCLQHRRQRTRKRSTSCQTRLLRSLVRSSSPDLTWKRILGPSMSSPSITCCPCWRCRSMHSQLELHRFCPADSQVSWSGLPFASQSCQPSIRFAQYLAESKIETYSCIRFTQYLAESTSEMRTYSCGVPPSTGVSIKGAFTLDYQSRLWDCWTHLKIFHDYK